jgi:hypothetical protein
MPFTITERKPIWVALSKLYLDTELSESTLLSIVETFKKSVFTLAEIKKIDRTEVFPVLQVNLVSVAGEWAGFDEEWLVETIVSSLEKRNAVTNIVNKIYYQKFKGMNKEYWERIEIFYNSL